MPDTILRIRVTALTDEALSTAQARLAECLDTINDSGVKAIAEFVVDDKPANPRDELTPAECRVAAAVAEGLATKRIGALLGCAEGTVKTHIKNAMRKVGAPNRTTLALMWAKRGVAQ